MKEHPSYAGFPPLQDKEQIVEALVNDPPEVRWRVVRDIFRINDEEDRQDLIRRLHPHLFGATDFRIKHRITMALQALHNPCQVEGYVVVKGKGAFRHKEMELPGGELENPEDPGAKSLFPVVDFHIHPKSPDLRFFADMREAGVTHGVILATDTDPSDVDRPEIKEHLRSAYSRSPRSRAVPFERMLLQIKASLYSPTHVENRDVADWVADYPEALIGFGSVNLSRGKDYVEEKLEEIGRLKLRGIKLLPYSQFFNAAENENVDLLFQYCADSGAIILSHSGCGPGPFEVPEISQYAHPGLWESHLKKYPSVPVVFAHFGSYSQYIPGIWLHEVLQLGKKYRNVYADLAAVDWLLNREVVVKEIRKTMGFGRVLFATDYPLPKSAGLSLAYLVGALKANTLLTEKEKRKVLGLNASQLLGLG